MIIFQILSYLNLKKAKQNPKKYKKALGDL